MFRMTEIQIQQNFNMLKQIIMIINTSNTWWSFSCDDANDWLKKKRKKKEWHLPSHENKCNILHDITYYRQDDTIIILNTNTTIRP